MPETSRFITGGTLPTDAWCYLSRDADQDLLENLFQGEFCYVLDTRQMGKSSLMVRTTQRLRDRGVFVAVIDLTTIGQSVSASQWYDGLTVALATQLSSFDPDVESALLDGLSDAPALGPLQRWMRALEGTVLPALVAADARLVVFVDEIDVVRSLPFPTGEFFAAIRACHNRRADNRDWERITFCLLGVATPADLIEDPHLSPFNIGVRIAVRDFTREQCLPLAPGLPGGDAAIDRILHWTGGHPYMTLRLCRTLADEAPTASRAEIDRVCERLFLTPSAVQTEDNLAFTRKRLAAADGDVSGRLTLYDDVLRGRPVPADDTDPLVASLRLAGVVREEGGRLQRRNRILARVFSRRWVAAHLPQAEVRRQRAAYRRGLLRATSLAALVILAFGFVTGIAVRQTRVAERALADAEATAARERLEKRRSRRLADERAEALLAARQALAQAARDRAAAVGSAARARKAAQAERIARDVATRREAQARRAAQRARDASRRADTNAQRERQATRAARRSADEARQSAREARRISYVSSLNLAQVAYQNNDFTSIDRLLDSTRDAPERDFEWHYLDRLTRDARRRPRFPTPIRWLALSTDGRQIALSDSDELRVQDRNSPAVRWRLRGGQLPIEGAFAGSKAERIVVCANGRVTLRDTRDGTIAAELDGSGTPRWPGDSLPVSFVGNGARLVGVTQDGRFGVWDAGTGHRIDAFGSTRRMAFAASPDGSLVAEGSDHSVTCWDVATRRQIARWTPHRTFVWRIALSPNRQRIVSVGVDGSVVLSDPRTGATIAQLKGHEGQVHAVAFSPDARRLVTGGIDHTLRVWNAADGSLAGIVRGHRGAVFSAAFLPDGVGLVAGGGEFGGEGDVLEARADAAEHVPLVAHTGAVIACAPSPDGRWLATGSRDHTVALWDVRRRSLVRRWRLSATAAAVAFLNPSTLLTGTMGGDLEAWDRDSGRRLWRIGGFSGGIEGLRLSPDRKTLAVASGANGHPVSLSLWEVRTRTRRWQATVGGGDDGAAAFAFTPDSRRIWCEGLGGRVLELDCADGRTRGDLPAPNATGMSISPDGASLAVATGGPQVPVWDLGTRRLRLTLRGHRNGVVSVSFTPNGRRLATAGVDGTMRLWDSGSGLQTLAVPVGVRYVWRLVASPDGAWIATAGGTYESGPEPGDVRLWLAR